MSPVPQVKTESERILKIQTEEGRPQENHTMYGELDDPSAAPQIRKCELLEWRMHHSCLVYRVANGRTRDEQTDYIDDHENIDDSFFSSESVQVVQEAQHSILKEKIDEEGLKDSILEQNGVTDPILLDRKGAVLNGNRRLAALRELLNENHNVREEVRVVVMKEEWGHRYDDLMEDLLQEVRATKSDFVWHNSYGNIKDRIESYMSSFGLSYDDACQKLIDQRGSTIAGVKISTSWYKKAKTAYEELCKCRKILRENSEWKVKFADFDNAEYAFNQGYVHTVYHGQKNTSPDMLSESEKEYARNRFCEILSLYYLAEDENGTVGTAGAQLGGGRALLYIQKTFKDVRKLIKADAASNGIEEGGAYSDAGEEDEFGGRESVVIDRLRTIKLPNDCSKEGQASWVESITKRYNGIEDNLTNADKSKEPLQHARKAASSIDALAAIISEGDVNQQAIKECIEQIKVDIVCIEEKL